MTDPLAYYATHGPITGPGEHSKLFEGLPDDLPDLCRIVQGLVVHPAWARAYNLTVEPGRQAELQLRVVTRMLDRIIELDDRPLTESRPSDKKLVGNCRDHTVLLCAMLRSLGVPARARCGFGAYFVPGRYEDHWVCEWWNASQGRWQLADAQLDDLQRRVLNIEFDTCYVPRDGFIVAGLAWQMCRSGNADPETFGLSSINEQGLWWVRQNLVRDMAALNKVELLPWDGWGLAEGMGNAVGAEAEALLDRVAVLTQDDGAFADLRRTYESEPRLRVPSTIRSNGPGGGRPVEIPA